MPDQERPSLSFLLKRGTLMGAALGMLAGLIVLAIQGVSTDQEVHSIIFWRNCILTGAAIGFLAAALFWKLHFKNNQESTKSAAGRRDQTDH